MQHNDPDSQQRSEVDFSIEVMKRNTAFTVQEVPKERR
jgi:hypothetical protein